MPDEDLWETFFDINLILDRLEISNKVGNVVEFGCGYGTFTIPTAKRIHGTIHALDIESDLVEATTKRALRSGLTNVAAEVRDFIADGSGRPDNQTDYAMLFNILHAESPVEILQEAARIVSSTGTIGVIHWIHNPATPRGPSLSIRPRPEQIILWAKQAGLHLIKNCHLPPWHYGLMLKK